MIDRKIYWVQQFFNEKELLKIKLETVLPYVDYFILSESNFTHSGLSKIFNLQEMIDEGFFKDYPDNKIIIQLVDDTPSEYVNLQHNPDKDYWYNVTVDRINKQTHWPKNNMSYGRDSWEKEILIRPLGMLNPNLDDIIIFSDMDEIINPEKLLWLRNNFDSSQIYKFEMKMFYYYLNFLSNEYWDTPLAASYQTCLKTPFCVLRYFSDAGILNDGGWHFSYLGNEDKIKTKIESFGEQYMNQDCFKNNLSNRIKNALIHHVDLYGRPQDFSILSITEKTMPKYVVYHQEEFENLILTSDKIYD